MTFIGLLIFSLVETVTVVLWAKVLGLGAGVPFGTALVAAIVLFVGYVIEHVIAFNVGKGRGLFDFPRP